MTTISIRKVDKEHALHMTTIHLRIVSRTYFSGSGREGYNLRSIPTISEWCATLSAQYRPSVRSGVNFHNSKYFLGKLFVKIKF